MLGIMGKVWQRKGHQAIAKHLHLHLHKQRAVEVSVELQGGGWLTSGQKTGWGSKGNMAQPCALQSSCWQLPKANKAKTN